MTNPHFSEKHAAEDRLRIAAPDMLAALKGALKAQEMHADHTREMIDKYKGTAAFVMLVKALSAAEAGIDATIAAISKAEPTPPTTPEDV